MCPELWSACVMFCYSTCGYMSASIASLRPHCILHPWQQAHGLAKILRDKTATMGHGILAMDHTLDSLGIQISQSMTHLYYLATRRTFQAGLSSAPISLLLIMTHGNMEVCQNHTQVYDTWCPSRKRQKCSPSLESM